MQAYVIVPGRSTVKRRIVPESLGNEYLIRKREIFEVVGKIFGNLGGTIEPSKRVGKRSYLGICSLTFFRINQRKCSEAVNMGLWR